MGHLVAIGNALPPPPSAIYFQKMVTTNRAAFSVPRLIRHPTRHPTVDCGMVDFLDQDGRSNLARPSQLGQGIKSPRRPNFAQNMHPIKRFRRSIARPNRTALLYPDVDHGVAVGRPRRFRFIAPIAFVGGMGG
jgi:hypothetical protein